MIRIYWEKQRSRHIGIGIVLDLAKRDLCICLIRRNIVIHLEEKGEL